MKNETVLSADNLTRYYEVKRGLFKSNAIVKALNGVSFELKKGQTLSVVGESGCGKSTLARLLTTIEKPTAGNLTIDGKLIDYNQKSDVTFVQNTVKIVFQDPYSSLNPRKTVGSILEEPLIINTNLNRAERQAKAYQMLENVGLIPETYFKYPHMFSGGQRQRVAIARALMLDPKIIVADEPVSALDISIQAQVLNLLMDLQERLDLSYVFISHGLSVVEHISDEVMVMYFGHVVEHGSKEDVFERPKHPYTVSLLSATPFVDPSKKRYNLKIEGELPSPLKPPSGCPFHARCPSAQDICAKEMPKIEKIDGVSVACHFPSSVL